MISKTIALQLNKQLNLEFFSMYQYLAHSAFCNLKSMNGFAHWFMLQALEEQMHAMKIYHYLLDQNQEVLLEKIEKPKTDVGSILQIMKESLAHEEKVTKSINDLIGAALKENDYATHAFLMWFITEQIEEESTVGDIVDQLALIKDSGEGLILLDRELGKRPAEEEKEGKAKKHSPS